jgi:hypothetical protein
MLDYGEQSYLEGKLNYTQFHGVAVMRVSVIIRAVDDLSLLIA